MFNFIPLVLADSQQLVIVTNTLVTEEGKVRIHLTLQNNGQRTLYDVQPMVHFHHTMAMMSKIIQLEPGQKIILENDDHPPVLRSGRYPLIIMTQYKTDLHMNLIRIFIRAHFIFASRWSLLLMGKSVRP